jgi:hypothetical protein
MPSFSIVSGIGAARGTYSSSRIGQSLRSVIFRTIAYQYHLPPRLIPLPNTPRPNIIPIIILRPADRHIPSKCDVNPPATAISGALRDRVEPVGLRRSAHEDECARTKGEFEWCRGGFRDPFRKRGILLLRSMRLPVFARRFVLEQEIAHAEEAKARDRGLLFEKVLVVAVVGYGVRPGGVVVDEGIVVCCSCCGFDALRVKGYIWSAEREVGGKGSAYPA